MDMTDDPSQTIALITGGNTGIGKATAIGLARLGGRVLITSRDQQKGAAAVRDIVEASGNDRVSQHRLDLASLDAVRRSAAELHEELDGLDVLVANAGLVTRHRSETPDGFETMFGVNHLGHFLFVNLVRDLVETAAPSRIVVVASDAHKFAREGLDFDDLQSVRSFSPMRTYGASKLANILFARELARRLAGSGVTVNAVHPGAVRTRLGRDGDGGILGEVVMRVVSPFFRSPAKGAATSVYAASHIDLAGQSGGYYANEAPAPLTDHARDDDAAAELWRVSEELTGLAG